MQKMLSKWAWPILIIVVMGSLVACGGDEEVDVDTPEPTVTLSGEEGMEGTVVATPTRRPTATPTATAEPVSGGMATVTPSPTATAATTSLVVRDQIVGEEGVIVIEEVMLAGAGWVAVEGMGDGGERAIVGWTAVGGGMANDVEVMVDPLQVAGEVTAVIYQDGDDVTTFDPLVDSERLAEANFEVSLDLLLPDIIVNEQDIGFDYQLVITSVVTTEPSWLIVQAEEDGEPGVVLAQWALAAAGRVDKLVIPINRYLATPDIYVTLHYNTDDVNQFEYPAGDPPMQIGGETVQKRIRIMMPPDILVFDQPIVEDTVIVERTISYGPGWIVAYSDEGGQLGRIIGSALLVDGVNEDVVLPVVASASTPVVHLVLHEDTGVLDEFEFPLADQQARYDNRLQQFSFMTNSGNFMIVRDQVLVDEQVTVAQVVVDQPIWAVIYTDNVGEPGIEMGRVALAAGYHQDVVVPVDTAIVSDGAWLVLHVDGGIPGTFEFPGEDVVLEHEREPIQVMFRLRSE